MSFNFNETPEATEFKPLDVGTYPCVITGSEWGNSKVNQDNRYLKLTLEVQGYKLFEYLNLVNTNEKAREIANSKTKSILMALGYTSFAFPTDSALAEAMMGNLSVKVGQKKESYNGDLVTKNIIKSYMALAPVQAGKPANHATAGTNLF